VVTSLHDEGISPSIQSSREPEKEYAVESDVSRWEGGFKVSLLFRG
jgi:hypothetical protein